MRRSTASTRRPLIRAGVLFCLLACGALSWAEVVSWNIDSANSYLRLTIPDQGLYVVSAGVNVTLQMRNADGTTWTDSGGRYTRLAGTLVTDYAEGTNGAATVAFLGGLHNIYALEQTSLRPSPLQWDSATSNYTGTATALAALGARVRAKYSIFSPFDAAYVAFRSATLAINNTTDLPISVVNGSFAGSTTRCSVNSGVDADGLVLPFGLGQAVPDTLGGSLGSTGLNTLGGTITNLVGLSRKMNYHFSVSNLVFNLSGTIVTGSIAGVVVASTTLPTPQPPPTLSARQVGGDIVLSWPTNAAGFFLEHATSLQVSNWSPVATTPAIVGDHNTVTNTMTGDAGFYRLHKP